MPNSHPNTVPDNHHLGRHERSERRRHHRAGRRNARYAALGNPYALVVGLGLIILGIVFFLENAGILQYTPLWALFLFIPAVGSFAAAWRLYQAEHALTVTIRGEIVAGLVLSVVAVMVLFNLNWAVLWAVFIIIAGLGTLLTVERD